MHNHEPSSVPPRELPTPAEAAVLVDRAEPTTVAADGIRQAQHSAVRPATIRDSVPEAVGDAQAVVLFDQRLPWVCGGDVLVYRSDHRSAHRYERLAGGTGSDAGAIAGNRTPEAVAEATG